MVAVEAAWLAPVLIACGLIGEFVGVSPVLEGGALLRLAVIALFVPALSEELFFRALLLKPNASLWRSALAVAAFVAWHPLQATFFGVDWAAVVLNPVFLIAVAALGVALTRVYLATRSIWPPVALHWIVVLMWKLAGGPSPW